MIVKGLFALCVAYFLALLASCSTPITPTPGPQPTPNPVPLLNLRGVIHVEGRWNARVYLGEVPVLTLIEGNKAANITILPRPPWATVDLVDPEASVDPTPSAAAAVRDGRLLIRRNGQPAGFGPMAPPAGPAPEPAAPAPFPPPAPQATGGDSPPAEEVR